MNHFCPRLNLNKNGDYAHFKQKNISPQNNLRMILIEKYSISQVYFHTQLIDKILSSSSKDKKDKTKQPETITIKDIGFDEQDEFMDKYYFKGQIHNELPELFEYYKYYTQQPICYLKHQFDIMYEYQQRKKAFLYNKLKKVLELSQTTKSLESLEKDSKVGNENLLGNLLSFLSRSKKSSKWEGVTNSKNDQSYCFKEISDNLNKIFGPSRAKTLNKIDRNFKFLSHNISFHRPKKNSEIIKNPTLKTMLESTNVSSKNAFIKKNVSKPEKNHKRYASVQSYKSPQQFEKKKLKRKSSMENISFPHHSKLDDRKIEEKKEKIQKKKQKSKWNELRLKGSEVRTETDLKSNILEIKKKINREKEMVCQTLPGSKLVKTKKR